jgi:DNA mismatch repair protein MutH
VAIILANIGLLAEAALVPLAIHQPQQELVVLGVELKEYLVDHGLVQVVEHLEIMQEDLL